MSIEISVTSEKTQVNIHCGNLPLSGNVTVKTEVRGHWSQHGPRKGFVTIDTQLCTKAKCQYGGGDRYKFDEVCTYLNIDQAEELLKQLTEAVIKATNPPAE